MKNVVEPLKVKKVKYLVYVSGKDLIGAFNNLDEFEEIFEDALDGIFEDFFRINELLKKNEKIWDFLVNEKMTFFNILLGVFEPKKLFTSFLIFIVVFVCLLKGLKFTQN